MDSVWCVASYRVGADGEPIRQAPYRWCACAVDAEPKTDFSVPTLCEHFVILPVGIALRQPTCEDCKTAQRKAKGKRA